MKTGAERVYSTRSPKRGWSWETLPAPIPESEITETIAAEVAIIGGGISGLAAGARCAEKGLRAVVIEKQEGFPASADPVGAADSNVMRGLGVTIDKAKLARDWLALTGSRPDEPLLWLFLDRSGEALDWLLSLAGDEIEVTLLTGYQGQDVKGHPGAHRIVRKPGSTKYSQAEGGPLVCEILQAELLKQGGRIDRGVQALQLLKDESGRVTGFLAMDAAGKIRRYLGAKGVILASGGIGGDRELLEAFCPLGLKPSVNHSSATGDSQKLAYRAGAALEPPQWASELHCDAFFPYPLFFLHVNRLGKRFMNEDTRDHSKAVRCMMQPGGSYAWTVMDGKWLADYEARFRSFNPDIAPEAVSQALSAALSDGSAVQADTLEELAAKMDVPADALKAAVSRYSELAKAGDDGDFGKRSEFLTTVETAPFYAVKWGPALEEVYGGILTDASLRVLTPEYEAIPGLYAAGSAAFGPFGLDYPTALGGASSGQALTWAYLAAEHIADAKEV